LFVSYAFVNQIFNIRTAPLRHFLIMPILCTIDYILLFLYTKTSLLQYFLHSNGLVILVSIEICGFLRQGFCFVSLSFIISRIPYPLHFNNRSWIQLKNQLKYKNLKLCPANLINYSKLFLLKFWFIQCENFLLHLKSEQERKLLKEIFEGEIPREIKNSFKTELSPKYSLPNLHE